MNLFLVGAMACIAAFSWWLSGYDSMVTGEDKASDLRRRAIRCGATLLLVAAGSTNPLLLLAAIVLIAVIWTGCLSELSARGFHRLVDPEDTRTFDANQTTRDLDTLAALVQRGRNDEAIELCKKLRESPETSTLAIETVMFQLYSRMFDGDSVGASPPVAEARRMRAQGNVANAASLLESLLQKEPENLRAAFLLMRVYAGDMQRPDRADALLRTLAQQPHVPPVFVEYARRCIHEWSGMASPRTQTAEGIESLLVNRADSRSAEQAGAADGASVDELLAGGHLATAVELLESQLKDQPDNLSLWLKLAEAHGVYCRNLHRAAKIIGRIEANPAFTKEQVQLAKSKLKEWRGDLQG